MSEGRNPREAGPKTVTVSRMSVVRTPVVIRAGPKIRGMAVLEGAKCDQR